MSVENKRGEALELVRELASADPGAVVAQMDAVADRLGDDSEALADLNAALGGIRARVRQMQVALGPHMSRLAAMEKAKAKAANMTPDEKAAMAQFLSLEGIDSTSDVRSSSALK